MTEQQYVPGEVIVKWRDGVAPARRHRVKEKHFLKDHAVGPHWEREGITHHHGVAHGREREVAERLMAAHKDEVLWAEPNGLLTVEPVSTGDREQETVDGIAQFVAGDDWWLVQAGVLAAAAGIPRLADIPIGIEDSGYRHAEPFFAGCIAAEKNFVTTVTSTGPAPDTTEDGEGHGTATLAIELSVLKRFTDKPRVCLARVMSQNSASWANVSQAVYWLIDLPQALQAIGCSIGGNTDSFSLRDAGAAAQAKGVAWICAAGNSASSTPAYPANTVGAYAIAATNEADGRAGFTNFGAWIDAAFPGTNFRCPNLSGGDSIFNGTSASAPGFAACVAVVAKHFGISGVAAVAKILAACKKLGDAGLGAGRADLAAALGVASQEPVPGPTPSPPPDPTPSPGDSLEDLTKSGEWTSSPTNPTQYGGTWEQLPQLIDGRVDTKCLWFNREPFVHVAFPAPVVIAALDLTSGNDYPDRDPVEITFMVDEETTGVQAVPPFSGRRVTQRVAFAAALEGSRFTFYLQNKAGGVTQLSELRAMGTASVDTPPPPPPPPDPEPVTLKPPLPGALQDIRTTIPTMTNAEERELLRSELKELVAAIP